MRGFTYAGRDEQGQTDVFSAHAEVQRKAAADDLAAASSFPLFSFTFADSRIVLAFRMNDAARRSD